MRSRFQRVTCGSALLLGLVSAARAEPLDYFEWSAVAPIVVLGESVGSRGGAVEVRLRWVYRGGLEPGATVPVDLKQANRNRDRQLYPKSLQLDEEASYLLLLRPSFEKRGVVYYGLVRGVAGVRPVPEEGGQALSEAISRFVEVQALRSEARKWASFEELVQARNPIILDTVVQQYLKFSRGTPELLPDLRVLLDHPSPRIREGATLLIGQILTRHDHSHLPDEPGLRNDLASRARRDPTVPVRLAAADALGAFGGIAVIEVLEEISESDPDQMVRYRAERILHDRRRQDID